MTNGEIKLVSKAVCIAIGSKDRFYTVKVDDNGILVEYVVAEITDSTADPQLQKEPKYELGHFHLPLITELDKLVEKLAAEIEEVESVCIGYKKF